MRWTAVLLATVGLTACGGETSQTQTVVITQTVEVSVAPPGAERGNPSAATVDAWKKAWCSIKLGMTRDEMVAVMGPPSSETADTLQWSAFEWTFNAKMDVDGTTYNLQWADATNPPEADVEDGELPCNWLRYVLD